MKRLILDKATKLVMLFFLQTVVHENTNTHTKGETEEQSEAIVSPPVSPAALF